MTWTNFWDALQANGAFPSAGLALIIIGATFRWLEQVSRFLGYLGRRSDPFAVSRDYVAEARAAGDDPTARRAEARLADQRRNMRRYGGAMMAAGVFIVVLSIWFN